MATHSTPSPAHLDHRVEVFIAGLARLAESWDKGHLAERLNEEIGRQRGLDATLVVAGETKRGKSSLLNALLGRPGLLPVDADLATNVRISIHQARPEVARVHLENASGPRDIPLKNVAEWASVGGNPHNERGVQIVEIGIDHPLLASGLTLVDTPGVGGLDAAHATITLSALSQADALLFVMDASAPLSAPELSFLRRATDRIGTVILVLTKRDVYQGWERILGENRTLLRSHAPRYADAPFVVLSSRAEERVQTARSAGQAEFAERLSVQSGYRELETALADNVIGRTRALRLRNALELARAAVDDLKQSEQALLSAIGGDGKIEAALKQATKRKQELTSKRVGSVALGDEFNLIGQATTREFNRRLDDVRSRYEQDVRANKLKPESVAESLDTDLRAILAALEEYLRERVRGVAERIARELELRVPVTMSTLDVPPELSAPLDPDDSSPDAVARVTSLMPSLSGAVMLPSLGSMIGGAFGLAAFTGGIGAVAGLALIPVNLVHRRRMRDQQDASRLVRTAVERARREVPPLLSEAIVTLRQAFQREVQVGVEQRERELTKAIEKKQHLLKAHTSKLTEAKKRGQLRLKELHKLRTEADELDREIVASTSQAEYLAV